MIFKCKLSSFGKPAVQYHKQTSPENEKQYEDDIVQNSDCDRACMSPLYV